MADVRLDIKAISVYNFRKTFLYEIHMTINSLTGTPLRVVAINTGMAKKQKTRGRKPIKYDLASANKTIGASANNTSTHCTN